MILLQFHQKIRQNDANLMKNFVNSLTGGGIFNATFQCLFSIRTCERFHGKFEIASKMSPFFYLVKCRIIVFLHSLLNKPILDTIS